MADRSWREGTHGEGVEAGGAGRLARAAGRDRAKDVGEVRRLRRRRRALGEGAHRVGDEDVGAGQRGGEACVGEERRQRSRLVWWTALLGVGGAAACAVRYSLLLRR